MANKTFQGRIVQKHDTKANWDKAINFVPLKGEIIVYDDLNKIKIGDGNTTVVNLSYSTTINYNDLINQPTIPTAISQLEDDTTFIVNMTGEGTTESHYVIDSDTTEITTQYNSDKKIYLKNSNKNILLPLIGTSTNMSIFGCLTLQNQITYCIIQGSVVVAYNTYHLENTTNKVKTLSSSSTDTQYPSAKAVYTELQNRLPAINDKIIIGRTKDMDDTVDPNGFSYELVKDKDDKNDVLTIQKIMNSTGSVVNRIELFSNRRIDDNFSNIRCLSAPEDDSDAANKKYVDDQIAANNHIVNKFTFTATAGQSTFTIPFNFEDSSALTVYYNGVMMKETDNYTVSGKIITLVDFTAKADDYLTVMGIEGAAAIDFGKDAEKAIAEINATKESATTEINTTKESATTEINGIKTSATNEITTVKTKAIKDINDLIATLPSDTTSLMFVNKTNTMAANSKITMDSKYAPSDDYDIATKKYVDEHVPEIDPAVGTTTKFSIYIGTTAPAVNTTPLLWIDTSSSGTFKYRTNTSSTTWTPVPVAWG